MKYECKNCRHGVFFNVDQSWLCNGGIAPEDPVKHKRYCEVVYERWSKNFGADSIREDTNE